jgi:uncharacterized C2H2 Zn-finger protein
MNEMRIDVLPEIWYPCPMCGTVFTNKTYLTTHYKEWHVTTNENPKDFVFNFKLPREVKAKGNKE